MEQKFEELIDCIENKNDNALFDKLLDEYINEEKGDMNRIGEGGHTLLSTAINETNMYIVEKLLHVGKIDLNVELNGYTALSFAAGKNTQILNLLLDQEDIDRNKPTSFPPLSRAIEKNKTKNVELLLEEPEKIDVHMKNTPPENRPLKVMERSGILNPTIVKLLIENGMEVDFTGEFEKSLLRNFLITAYDKQIIHKLLSRKDVDVNGYFSKERLLFIAIKGNHYFLLDTLLEHPDIDPNVYDDPRYPNKVPLMVYDEGISNDVEFEMNKRKVNLLLRHPDIEVDAVDNKGQTTILQLVKVLNKQNLSRASNRIIFDTIIDIVKSGGNPTIPDHTGFTIEHYGENIPDIIAKIIETYTKNENEK